jgi:uncharacterized delta-60 repeat protein
MLRPFHPRPGVPTRTTRPVPSLLAGHVLLRLLPVAGLLAWQLVVAQPAQARAGALDPSFGRHGMVTTDFGGTDGAGKLVVQADGKLVAAGVTISTLSPAQGYIALARYTANGSLDASFGTGGKVTTDFFPGGSQYGARALVVQADGKPVIAGTAATGGPGGAHGFALARFNPDGSLDPTFGTGGKVITEFAGGSEDGAAALVMQGGKLVAGGTALNLQTLDLDFALARYNPDGSLDQSFGSGGRVTTDLGGPDGDYGYGVAVQADGKPVATGLVDNGAEPQCGFARYNLDGSLDQSFGTGGNVTAVGGTAGALAVQGSKLVTAGGSGTAGGDFVLARFRAR